MAIGTFVGNMGLQAIAQRELQDRDYLEAVRTGTLEQQALTLEENRAAASDKRRERATNEAIRAAAQGVARDNQEIRKSNTAAIAARSAAMASPLGGVESSNQSMDGYDPPPPPKPENGRAQSLMAMRDAAAQAGDYMKVAEFDKLHHSLKTEGVTDAVKAMLGGGSAKEVEQILNTNGVNRVVPGSLKFSANGDVTATNADTGLQIPAFNVQKMAVLLGLVKPDEYASAGDGVVYNRRTGETKGSPRLKEGEAVLGPDNTITVKNPKTFAPPTPKDVGPKLIKFEDTNPDGTKSTRLVDENTGAYGRVVPGKPAVPGKSHIFGANEPDSPAEPERMEWFDASNRPLPGGVASLYAGRQPRGAGAGGNADAAAPADAIQRAQEGVQRALKAGAKPEELQQELRAKGYDDVAIGRILGQPSAKPASRPAAARLGGVSNPGAVRAADATAQPAAPAWGVTGAPVSSSASKLPMQYQEIPPPPTHVSQREFNAWERQYGEQYQINQQIERDKQAAANAAKDEKYRASSLAARGIRFREQAATAPQAGVR